MPDVTLAMIESFPRVASIYGNPKQKKSARGPVRVVGADEGYLHAREPLVVAIAEVGVRVQLDGLKLVHNGNAGPTEFLDGDEGLMEVLVLGDEVRADVNGESLGTEDVGGGLREVCGDATAEQIAI